MKVYTFNLRSNETERMWEFVSKNYNYINIRFVSATAIGHYTYEAETDEETFIALNLVVPIAVLHDK